MLQPHGPKNKAIAKIYVSLDLKYFSSFKSYYIKCSLPVEENTLQSQDRIVKESLNPSNTGDCRHLELQVQPDIAVNKYHMSKNR